MVHKKKLRKKDNIVPLNTKGKNVSVDRLHSEIIDYMKKRLATKDGKSLLAETLGEERLVELAEERSYEDLKLITEAVYASMYWLAEYGFNYAIDKLLEKKTLEKLYSSLPYKADQLQQGLYELCGRGKGFSAVVERFFTAVMENLDKRILWKPMVDELMTFDELGAIRYFQDGSYENYLQKWDESVALLDEAIAKWGLREYARLVSGTGVGLQEGSNFCTNATGAIYSPSYLNMFPGREQNLRSIRRSVVHECGHHRWRSFRINVHQDALRLDLVGARFIKEEPCPKSGKKSFLISTKEKGKEKTVHVKTYKELIKIVKYPKMLAWLHNVADDKRIDALNMYDLEGLADEYMEDAEYILSKRPKLKGNTLKDLFEALLQQTVAGRTNSEVPKELKGMMERLNDSLSMMEIRGDGRGGENTDGTDSMNVALRWYVDLEPELDALAKRIIVKDGDINTEIAKMLPEGFFDSDTDIEEVDVRLLRDNPAPIILSKRRRGPRFGRRTMEQDPFSFLNIPQDLEPDDGEGGEDDGTPTEGSGRDMRPRDTGEGSRGEAEGKTYRYNEWAGDGYRPGTKPLIEHSLDGTQVMAPRHLRQKVKRMFKRYAPKTGELVRGVESGHPDPALLEQYLEAVEAGMVPEPNYFANVVYERSNVVMSVNIDMSSSMKENINGRTKMDIAIEGGAVLAAAASILKYPIEVSGFTGAETVDFYLLRATDNGIVVPDMQVNATPMAGAVRHATQRTLKLRKRSGKRFAYQFWLCDAEPNCSGEGINPTVDTAKAVQEARANGIKTFGIIIGTEERKKQLEEDYRQIFGGGWYVVTTSAEKILNPLLAFMRRIAYFR